MNILCIIMFMIAPLVVSAQLQSSNYYSPTRGIISSGGAIQSQNHNASGTVPWYDATVSTSTNYTQTGIGNIEILNGKGTIGVEETTIQTVVGTIFPSPLQEESFLRFYAPKTGKITLELFDYTGSKLHSEVIVLSVIGETSVSLREFYHQVSAGVYLLKVKFETEVKTLIILKL